MDRNIRRSSSAWPDAGIELNLKPVGIMASSQVASAISRLERQRIDGKRIELLDLIHALPDMMISTVTLP